MKMLIADDHRLIREGLKPLLHQLDPGAQLCEAWDATSLWAAARGHPDLDLALIDLDMPGMEGTRGLARMRDEFPSLPIIVVSGSEEPNAVEELLRLGTSGYIPKSSSSAVMLQAIRLVLAGGQYLPPLLLMSTTRTDTDGMRLGDADIVGVGTRRLSPRQEEVLRLLADGQTNKMIARALGVSLGTVKTHLVQIFQILGVHNRTSAVLAARALRTEPRSQTGF